MNRCMEEGGEDSMKSDQWRGKYLNGGTGSILDIWVSGKKSNRTQREFNLKPGQALSSFFFSSLSLSPFLFFSHSSVNLRTCSLTCIERTWERIQTASGFGSNRLEPRFNPALLPWYNLPCNQVKHRSGLLEPFLAVPASNFSAPYVRDNVRSSRVHRCFIIVSITLR